MGAALTRGPARALGAALLLGAAGCQCVRFEPGTAFRCDQGECPKGYFCALDGFCDLLAADGGEGGGAGGSGGGAGGAGGSGGGAALSPCAQAWCWDHPQPWGGARFNGLHVRGANDVWLAGENGAAFHWNGAKWQQVASPSRFSLSDVWVSPGGDVWMVGDVGTVLHLEQGRLVSRGPTGVTDDYAAISGTAGDDFWAVGQATRVSRYQQGQWSHLPSAPTGVSYWGVSAVDPARTVVVGGAMQHWTGGQLSQVPKPSGDLLRAVWANPTGDLWVGGANGALYKAAGGVPTSATGWTPVTSGLAGTINSVWGTAAGELYYGSGGGIFVTSPGFSGNVSTQGNITAIDGTDASNVWATSFDGPVVKRNISGGPFSDARTLSSATTLDLYAVALAPDGVAWAAGANHVAMRRTAQGQWFTVQVETNPAAGGFWGAWADANDRAVLVGNDPVRLAVYDPPSGFFRKPSTFTPSQGLWTVWGSGPDDIWAGGDGSYLIHWNGQQWSQSAALPKTFNIYGIWGTGPDDFYLVGTYQTILHWNGTQFLVENENGGQQLYAVGGTGPDDVYAVGPGGLVMRRTLSGTWATEVVSNAPVLSSVAGADGTVMLTSDDGHIFTRLGAGSWQRVATGKRTAVQMYDLAAQPGLGFFAVGQGGTVLRWAP